mmetsp:Transcript_97641/g.304494  ORF Transcript_97641/g.304494 Transcript_97641/m.304494 type:complete len:272 (-) Transcript_97641:46-861(-)
MLNLGRRNCSRESWKTGALKRAINFLRSSLWRHRSCTELSLWNAECCCAVRSSRKLKIHRLQGQTCSMAFTSIVLQRISLKPRTSTGGRPSTSGGSSHVHRRFWKPTRKRRWTAFPPGCRKLLPWPRVFLAAEFAPSVNCGGTPPVKLCSSCANMFPFSPWMYTPGTRFTMFIIVVEPERPVATTKRNLLRHSSGSTQPGHQSLNRWRLGRRARLLALCCSVHDSRSIKEGRCGSSPVLPHAASTRSRSAMRSKGSRSHVRKTGSPISGDA